MKQNTLPQTTDLGALTDPAQRVLISCERAKVWLSELLDSGEIEQIVELKSQAEAIRVYTMQKQLGKDAGLSAAEIVRRAERCIGLAIRKGQKEGRITKPSEHASSTGTSSPRGLHGSAQERRSTYAMTDGVSPERFEQAISEAKAERNLSRANVVRRVKGNGKANRWAALASLATSGSTSHQIAAKLGVKPQTVRNKARELKIEIRADRVVGKATLPNQTRILMGFANSLESLIPSCDMIDAGQIDRKTIKEAVSILNESIPALTKLRRKLRRKISDGSSTK